jgi:signal transduction histidine kinase
MAPDVSSSTVARGYPRLAALLVIGLGSAVLVGWVADIPVLKSFVPGLIEMKVNTAVCFILAGIALWLRAVPEAAAPARWCGSACAMLVLFLGAGSLAEWLFGWDLHIDQLFFVEPASAVYTSAPGRMAPNTALNFICDSLALLLIDVRWRLLRPAQVLCLIEIVMAMLALFVYVYGVGKVFGLLQFTPMAVHTAVGFLVLSTGILWARPEAGAMTLITSRTSGGTLVRRMLPAVVIVPLVIALACIQGISHELIDVSFAFAVFTVATIILLAAPLWFVARTVFAAEQARLSQVEAAEAHAAELARVNGELKELQHSKDLLTGMVIHDLRNPLSACIGYLDLAERHQKILTPDILRYITHARDASLRLLDMINGIVDIIRMEDGKMPAKFEPTDVTALVAAKIQQYQGASSQAGLELVHRHPPEGTSVSTDATLLGRVIDNLVINAIKHTRRGGVVTIEESSSPEHGVTLRVIDTGEGIAPADLGRLFQKYGRAENQAMGRKYDTGLGLVFCRMAVELLHGSIQVKSELGKGSTFIVDLDARR